MISRDRAPRRQPRWCNRPFIIGVALLALLLKLQIAHTTIGSNDVMTWKHFTTQIQTIGLAELYRQERLFNHPPLVGQLLPIVGWLGTHTSLPFAFWMRLPAILADLMTVIVLLRLVGPTLPVLMLAACPPLVMISGFHGNTDPVMIMWVFVAVWLLSRAPLTSRCVFVAGAALGLGVSTKIVPVVLLPAFLLWLPSWRTRITFVVGLSAVVLAGALSMLRLVAAALVRNVIAYPSNGGQWGLGRLFWLSHRAPRLDWLSVVERLFMREGRLLDGLAIILLAVWLNRAGRNKAPLLLQCSLTLLGFLALSPGFGVQYLAWVMPGLVVAELPAVLLVYVTSSAFLAAVYSFWSGGWPWYYAGSPPDGWSTQWPIIAVEVATWLAIVAAAVMLGLSARSSNQLRRESAARVTAVSPRWLHGTAATEDR